MICVGIESGGICVGTTVTRHLKFRFQGGVHVHPVHPPESAPENDTSKVTGIRAGPEFGNVRAW